MQDGLKVLSRMRKVQPLQYAYLVKADRLLERYRQHYKSSRRANFRLLE